MVKQTWKLASSEKVADRPDSHLDPKIFEFLPAVFASIQAKSREKFIQYSHDFGTVIGKTICVKTYPRDKIIYACLNNRPDGHTRFVQDREPENTSWLTVGLKLLDDGGYEIRTAYIGEQANRLLFGAKKIQYNSDSIGLFFYCY